MTQQGTFRKDLFFRLNVVRIHLPPLRERLEDIPFLLRHYCGELGSESSSSDPEFSEDSLRCLKSYGWPGNIRELRNFVENFIFERSAAENRNRASAASHSRTH